MKSPIYKREIDYKFRAYGREEAQNKKLEVMLAVSREGLAFLYINSLAMATMALT